jgi:hypothetical protein
MRYENNRSHNRDDDAADNVAALEIRHSGCLSARSEGASRPHVTVLRSQRINPSVLERKEK